VLLQIGGPSDLSLVRSSTVRHQVYFSLDGAVSAGVPSIQGELEHLPLQAECVDVVLLVHALSCTQDPRRVLSQLYTALRPGGQLLILGFNPWSLWGLSRFFSHQDGFPWAGRFHSAWQIRRDLRAIQYQLIAAHTFCFHRPSNRNTTWSSAQVTETLGSLLLPGCGGVYMILAQKEAAGMMPLADAWAVRKKNAMMADWAKSSAQRNVQ